MYALRLNDPTPRTDDWLTGAPPPGRLVQLGAVQAIPAPLLGQVPDLSQARERLLQHALYHQVNTLERLRQFMADHVFAVWDFMSLVKRLQHELTALTLPWQPSSDAAMARFINAIVLSEESDEGVDGVPMSHLALYLAAMEEVGADTRRFQTFAAQLAGGASPQDALAAAAVPPYVQDFVLHTLACALNGETIEVLGAFLYGREDVIPAMFERLLSLWSDCREQVPMFAYYLERHITLDGVEHGPAARQMLARYAHDDARLWRQAGQAAEAAIRARIRLWDHILCAVSGMPVAVERPTVPPKDEALRHTWLDNIPSGEK